MDRIISLVSRVLFLGAFALAALAVWEKAANLMGFTVVRAVVTYWAIRPSRLLELAVVALVFVIAIQIRELKRSSETRRA